MNLLHIGWSCKSRNSSTSPDLQLWQTKDQRLQSNQKNHKLSYHKEQESKAGVQD